MTFDLSGKRVFVSGHRGMVGSAIVRLLGDEGCEILTAGRNQIDLRDAARVRAWFEREKPNAVFLAAAKVGGIRANDTYPADFLYDNLAIALNVIDASYRSGVEKLVYLGSSCIYPKFAPQPIPESALLSGSLEPTNAWYAIAKIAGLKLCEAYRRQYAADFISAMPANLYGPGDNFDLAKSHVIPALLRKAHDAKRAKASQIVVWGSGTARREFLHVDDAVRAIVHLMKTYSGPGHINVGSGEDIAILDLAKLICRIVGFDGAVVTDPSKPDGTPKKLLDVSKLKAMGWQPRYDLRTGLNDVYEWFKANEATARLAV
jgi:GDP-L-fucose synthase